MNHGEWVHSALTSALSWLSTHGFVLNNREEAALIWLVILTAFVLSKSDIHSSLVALLRLAVTPKLASVWIIYFVWVISLVLVADRIGIWRAILTKDTLVWGLTAGIILLAGVTEAAEPGYFRRALSEVLGVVVIFEYIMNLVSFSLLFEFLLQPALFIVMVSPSVAMEPEWQETWEQVKVGFLTILLVTVVGHTARTLHASWETIDWELFVLRAVWPMLLGTWVLMLVFALGIVASYEEAFLRLGQYRDGRKGLWKAKLGLVLALGIRLRWIHEAAEGGTHHVARAESVGTAYEAAKCYKTELVAAKSQEAAT